MLSTDKKPSANWIMSRNPSSDLNRLAPGTCARYIKEWTDPRALRRHLGGLCSVEACCYSFLACWCTPKPMWLHFYYFCLPQVHSSMMLSQRGQEVTEAWTWCGVYSSVSPLLLILHQNSFIFFLRLLQLQYNCNATGSHSNIYFCFCVAFDWMQACTWADLA